MSNLIPLGAVITLMGLLGLIWCIYKVARARKQGLSDEDLRAVMQTTVGLNLGALLLSAVGLMMVVLGIILA
ncbi:hypothetical protein BDE40_0624 [Litoreibacter halocynthiae]|uniref:Uncharacterized protein n=1 Tax=Litoreibacter halocynthiae TaxID=1242689 RepID=A0A4R7LS58_9RHOB|nr:hypothetical protein [Litoreibacter halocynthiae]TDT77341.1 hypothetical protein BDE40_0624 [Litoreibacter halocynthiae]